MDDEANFSDVYECFDKQLKIVMFLISNIKKMMKQKPYRVVFVRLCSSFVNKNMFPVLKSFIK